MAGYGYQHGTSDHLGWDAAPNQNSEYYVTRTTKTIVQEHVLPPFASDINQPHLWSPRNHQVVPKYQSEASKPNFRPMSASTWHNTTKPTGHAGEPKPTGNGHRNDFYDDNGKYSSHGKPTGHASEPKPTGNGHRNDVYDDNSLKYGSHGAPKAPHYRHVDPILVDTFDELVHVPKEATLGAHGGRVGPSPTVWASPPNSNLSKPTSDIPMAIEILKEVARPIVYTEPKYVETIDSMEAAKRYGNNGRSNFSPGRYEAEDGYMTIDSREAARKYNGAIV